MSCTKWLQEASRVGLQAVLPELNSNAQQRALDVGPVPWTRSLSPCSRWVAGQGPPGAEGH